MLTLKTFLLLFAGFAYSNALSSFQCARFCKEESENFGYEIGKVYKYDYSGHVRSLVNTSKTNDDVVNESGVNIQSTVAFQALSSCDYVMQIIDVTITDYHIKNALKTGTVDQKYAHLERTLKQRPLHFAFNGKIDTICHEKSEVKEIVDIKRGILSVFQNSNANFKPNALVYETDITGNCETHYKVTESNGIKHINKTKNLDACDHRMSHYLSWQTVPYMTHGNSKSLPLLKSTLNCQLNYGKIVGHKDIFQDSLCYEKHVFQPFSNGDNGAVTTITQQLRFVSAELSDNVYKAPEDVKRSTLIYEYNNDNVDVKDSMTALTMLSELERKTADGVDVDVPSLFSNLVFEFQHLSKSMLLEMFNNINQNQRKFYIDAISLITTTSGIEVMADLYENKKIDDNQMNSWLVSLNFLKNPTKKTLQVIYPLTFHTKIKQNSLLALSSLLYKYCAKQSNCLDDVVVLEIVKNIEKPIGNNCVPTSSYNKNEIFLALKSIGNAGQTTSYYSLQNCYLNDELSIELRLAAIAAHRRMKCAENENIDDFKSLFANARANSEVRIASYLATMQCASYSLFAQVKDVLIKEEANQVGSFIWTHLTNLQETSMPWKQGIRKLLENEFLKNKFNTDIRKYSRNYEASTFFDSVGAGGGLESNIIFSSESYLPRSAMLNFTLDLFGETINVLELGTRVEGFEDIVENLFGTNGYFSDETVHNYLESAKENHHHEKLDAFNDKFQMLPKEPSGSIYAKIFGNEISYSQFNNLQDLFGMPNSGREALDMLMKFIKENDVAYTKSFSFLDSTYKIPTIIGFPLQLKANGTATVGLTAGGEINVKDLWNYKMLIKGKIYPSASVQITSTMSVDTYAGETGIQYIGTLNSNTYIDGYANMELGKIVDVKINVPKKQMDIFTVASDVHIIHNEIAFPIQDASTKIENSQYCSHDYVNRLTGVQFCNQWRFVNASSTLSTPNFPLTGSFRYSLHIKKIDTFEFYHLYLETQLTDASVPYLINFFIDTPSSTIDRKIQTLLSVDFKTFKLNAQVQSPLGSFELASNIERDDAPKYKFQLLTTLNNKEIVTVQSTFDVKDDGMQVTYEPLAKLNYKRQQIVALTGKLSHVKGGNYSADLKLEGITKDVAQIYGSFSCGSDFLNVKANILSTSLKGALEANLNVRPNDVLVASRLNYTYNDNANELIRFTGRYNKSIVHDNIASNMLLVDFQTSEWPRYNTILNWRNQHGHLYFNNTADLTFFETAWKTHQILKLDAGFSVDHPDLLFLVDLVCPEKNIDYKTEVSYKSSLHSLRSRAVFQLNRTQRFEALVDYNSEHNQDKLYILVYYPQQSWILNGELSKHTSGEYEFGLDCQHKSLGKEYVIMQMRGDYLNTSLGELQNHKINCTLDFPEMKTAWNTPWILTATLQKSHTMLLSYSKLTTKEGDYVGHLNWIEDSLALSLHANDKPLFIINGARTDEAISVGVALNIYQYMTLSVKLALPYQSFELQFYWDKDRDEDQRFLFTVERNAFKGEYNMDIEYPNQKITTNIILMPTQVIMNVTWGLQISQRIYLKIGNKYYDVGGLWFGELETPFRYLEKQQFSLKYYVVTDSFEVQSDLSWRLHSINLLISGSKSIDHLNANLQLNTTLAEIRKVGAALSHAYQITNNNYKSDAAFDYNEHEIRAQSNWRMDGYRVDSQFRIESPTQTIDPIFGELKLNDVDDTCNTMQFVLNWQKKNITAAYDFKSDTSSIEIETPFEGIEKTILKYSVVTNADTVYLATTVDLFRQNNSISLCWTNTHDSTTFWVDLMSPMTGRYNVYFTHSVLLGVLKENFKIQGPDEKDLLRMTIEGDIMPVLKMNVTASLVLLDHDALITITNTREPLLSNVVAIWNERTIYSKIFLKFNETQLDSFNWFVESNIFQPVNVSYERVDNEYVTKIVLPNDYKLANRFIRHKNNWQNNIHLQTPTFAVEFNHETRDNALNQYLIANLDEKHIYYVFNASQVNSEKKFHVIYNFYERNNILHSYNVSGTVQQTTGNEQVSLAINSTSQLNGKLYFERVIAEKLKDNSVEMLINFGPFIDIEMIGNREFFLWNNRLNGKLVKVNYKWKNQKIETKLLSTYEEIPSANLQLRTTENNLELKANMNDYHLYLLSGTSNITFLLKQQKVERAKINLHFKTINQLNSLVIVNLDPNKYLRFVFDYDINNVSTSMVSTISWPGNAGRFESKFNKNQQVGKIECQFNEQVYTGLINGSSNGDVFNLNVKTPEDEYTGKYKIARGILGNSFAVELSSQTSKNYFSFVRNLDHLNLTTLSDYFRIGKQDVNFIWAAQDRWSGVGYYNNGTNKYKFTIEIKNFKNWTVASYRPNGALYFNLHMTGRFESKKDFEASVQGTLDRQKIQFDVKNYFGTYYHTMFNLVTPIKGWTRTSLDCTLNDRKIGIALLGKNQQMSLIARRTGGELLNIEYQGETLLEISSGEGHMTLRTTSRLGKYRLFVQSTQNPGIYVFSILRNGENVISFVLQNYSVDDVMHYKGKLLAPDIIPNNATLAVEFKARTKIWKLLDFKMKKDNKPLLELGWENNIFDRHSYSGLIKFNSQIDSLPSFKIRPRVIDNGSDVEVEVKYPCEKYAECSFSLLVNSNRLVCTSQSPIDQLTFHLQTSYFDDKRLFAADFTFNDFKHTNIAYNITLKRLEYLQITGSLNIFAHSSIVTLNTIEKDFHFEVVSTDKYLILAKSKFLRENVMFDLYLPNFSAKGNISTSSGSGFGSSSVLLSNCGNKYDLTWSHFDKELSAVLKENAKQIATVTYRNALVTSSASLKSDIALHVAYREQKADAIVSGQITNDTVKATFTLFTPFESISRVKLGSLIKLSPEKLHLEQYLQLPTDEFVLNASATSTKRGQIVRLYCKPFNNPLMNKTITAKAITSSKQEFKFDVDFGDNFIYKVYAYPSNRNNSEEFYVINVTKDTTKDVVEVAHLKFNKNSIDFTVKSIGIVDNIKMELNNERFLVASQIFNYEQLVFASQKTFAFALVVNELKQNKHETLGVIYKPVGVVLPKVDFFKIPTEQFDSNQLVVSGNLRKTGFKFNLFEKTNGSLELQTNNQVVRASFEENQTAYIFSTANALKLHTLIVNKNFTKITNEIFMPFDIEMKNQIFKIKSENCSIEIGKLHNHIDMYLNNNHFQFYLDLAGKLKVMLQRQNDEKLLLLVDRRRILEFAINDLLAFNFNLTDDKFLSYVKYKIGTDEIESKILAESISNVTFSLFKNQAPSVIMTSTFNQSSIAYHINVPKWNLMRLVDVAFSWNNKQDKHFAGSVIVDSEYTGEVNAHTKFDLQRDLLDIEAAFKAPFLDGFETFYGKVYLPKEFRPRIELVLPNQTYKLFYNYSSTHVDAGVVCMNEKTEIFSFVFEDPGHWEAMKMLRVVFPDERFKKLVVMYNGKTRFFKVEINDGYVVAFGDDLTYVDVRSPIVGYEKFGYHLQTGQGQSENVGFTIVHPAFEEPLGMNLRLKQQNGISLDMVYSLHVPFTINNCNFMVVNVTGKLLTNDVNVHINVLSNNIDIGMDFGVLLNSENEISLTGQMHFNDNYLIGNLTIEETKMFLIAGNVNKKELELIETLFPNYEHFMSPNLYMLYLSYLPNYTFDLLVHTKWQPFSLRRSGDNVKLIWDLRQPTKTLLGGKVNATCLEVYFVDNVIVTTRNSANGNDLKLTLQLNTQHFEYRSTCRNVSSLGDSMHNVTSIRALHTPLGTLALTKHTSVTVTSLIDRVEFVWGNRGTKRQSKLIFNNKITTPGTLTSTIASTMLPHDVVLNVDMSEFKSIPSVFEASLSYSNRSDKTINFRMYYNKTYADDRVTTDRIFIVKHPSSMIDYELYFNAMRMPDFSNGSIVLKYKDFDTNANEMIRASVKVDHSRFGVLAEVTTNKNRFNFMAMSTSGHHRHGFQMNIEINDKDPLNLDCTYDFKQESPSVSLMAAYGNSRKYIFYAGLPNEKEITAKLGHELYGKASLDAFAIIKLNTSQLLWIKMLWKDNLYAPFHEAIFDEYNDLRFVIEATGKQLIDVIHDDIGKEFVTDFAAIKERIVNCTMNELDETLKEFRKGEMRCDDSSNMICTFLFENEQLVQFGEFLKENLTLMYNSVDKVFRSSLHSVRMLFDAMNFEIEKAMKDIKNIQNIKVDAKAILKKGINTARKSLKEMESIAVKLLDDFDKYISSLKEQVEEFFEPFLNLVDDFIAYLEQRLAMLQIAILDTLDTIQHYIFNLREIKAVYSVYYSYINWLEELHVIDMLEPIGDVIEEILETIIVDVKRVLDHYKPYLDALGDAIFGKYDGIHQLPPIAEMREHVNRIYHKTIWVWNYHNMTEGLKLCVKKFSKDIDSVLSFVEFDETLPTNEDIDYPFGYNYVFRPENRLIEISQPLPVEWEAFNKSPSFEHYPLYQRIQGKSEQFIKFYKSRYDLIDMLENFVVDLYEPSISPSTYNYAMIIGKSQYSTFNGLNYNFLSNCSYFLATDFKTKSFSLIVNYKNTTGNITKSYEILTNDSSFEIFSETLITLNGKRMDLPIVHKQVTITKENDNIVAESSRGFKMTCYFHYNFCTVQLSGWLFGKTAGLLGTLDNEQATDSLSSQRRPSADIAAFLASWQLQDQCALIETPNLHSPPNDELALEYVGHLCDLLFNDQASPLSKCFDTVEPKQYAEMCYNELKANPELKVCAPAAAYVHRCRRAKVAIEMPELCVTCQDDIGYVEEIFDGHNNKTVDVVFITELDCYNGTTIMLPKLLDEDLNKIGFNGNRFAAVGYGGNTLPKPHVYTYDGNVWNHGNKLVIKSQLTGGNVNTKSKFTAIDALKYAASLEYRIGVSKLFILTQCEVATDISNSPAIYNMLGEKDVTLHVLKPKPFGNQSDQIAGINMHEFVLPSAINAFVNHNLNQIINNIDDVYSGLALSTNGTIFDLSKVYEDNEDAALWAQLVTKHIQRSPCQKCKCVQDFNGVGKIECSRCLAPAVKQFLNEYEEGNKMKFNDNDIDND